ncbi:MAG: SET domain-containing protein-lysine N-methyltransferase, partial [Chitinivibrionales bacterium]|nr:SET domain-containing protein-lysine N-methyltransferase [Chitinivibrionales bacterium]
PHTPINKKVAKPEKIATFKTQMVPIHQCLGISNPDLIPDFYISPKIRIAEIEGKGLGVIAIEEIACNEIIECSPVIILSPNKSLNAQWRRLHRVMLETLYNDHHYWWTLKYGALALGYGSLYNHSDNPNSETIKLLKKRKIIFKATCAIKRFSEITRSYKNVWFSTQSPKNEHTFN